MSEGTKKKDAMSNKKTMSLREFGRREMLLTLISFAILLAVVGYTSYQSVNAVEKLNLSYSQQLKLERLRASLPAALLPLNDFLLSKNEENIQKIEQANKTFSSLLQEVKEIPFLSESDGAELKSIAQLMNEVGTISLDITSGKIPLEQAQSLVIVAQSLVFVGQDKLSKVVHSVEVISGEIIQKNDSQLSVLMWVNLLLIAAVALMLIVLNSKFIESVTQYISKAAEDVADSSENILEAAERQATASSTQAGTVNGVTEELDEMSQAAAKIAATANSVERIASATSVAAVEGGAAVSEAIGHMGIIREEVMAIAEKVSDAGRKAEQILESVDSIQEIADETHLLALNASIESSAAGEFGKRFAVVASEVRRLSERAKEFTEEIQVVVNEVHVSTKESIAVTQKGLESVAKGVQIAQRAGAALGKMEDMSEKTSKAVRTISMATQRQSDNSQEFVEAMQAIANLIQDSASHMEGSRDAAEQLNDVAEKLRNFV